MCYLELGKEKAGLSSWRSTSNSKTSGQKYGTSLPYLFSLLVFSNDCINAIWSKWNPWIGSSGIVHVCV